MAGAPSTLGENNYLEKVSSKVLGFGSLTGLSSCNTSAEERGGWEQAAGGSRLASPDSVLSGELGDL